MTNPEIAPIRAGTPLNFQVLLRLRKNDPAMFRAARSIIISYGRNFDAEWEEWERTRVEATNDQPD